MKILTYSSLYLAIVSMVALFVSACGQDRSGEQPFVPTVQTGVAAQVADSVQLTGSIITSPNSQVLERGFEYGNDTLRSSVVSTDTTNVFAAFTDSLGKGSYYAVAYARNGVGIGRGDTIRFVVR